LLSKKNFFLRVKESFVLCFAPLGLPPPPFTHIHAHTQTNTSISLLSRPSFHIILCVWISDANTT
jgi:hypothetical protein